MPQEEDYHPIAVGQTRFTDELGEEAIDTILDRIQASDAMMAVAQIRVLGGAMARVPDDATAFAHRQSRLMVTVANVYERVEDTPVHQAWVDEFAGALGLNGRGAYVNFLGEEGDEGVRAAYPDPTWQRLRELKRRYDPTNVFRLNQNIPPEEDR
jgi:FAD/FMN-containing dehydrogenase